jgi:CarD family transcriptional regulator
MHQSTEHVVHPRHGVGTITGIEEVELGGESKRYYRMELLEDRGFVLIPDDQIDDVGLRPVSLSRDQVTRIMQEVPHDFPSNNRQRESEIKSNFESGEPASAIRLLRDLYWLSRQRNLSAADTRYRTRTFMLVMHELVLQTGMEVEAARDWLNHVIHEAMHDHLAAREAAVEH